MSIRLLLEHGQAVYDATNIVTDGVSWESSMRGEAGRLRFSLVRDGIVNFVEGDKVQFYTDGILKFSGWVMTKERTQEQIIQVTAYDQMFYLAKNRGTYVYWDKTASEVVSMIASDYGLAVGPLADTGWKIPQRIEEGQTLLDMMMTALDLTEAATGKEYFLFDDYGRLTLKERSQMDTAGVFCCDGGIGSYTYQTDISEDTINGVRLYQAGRKETEHLAYEMADSEKTEQWGRLYAYRHVDFTLNEAQMKEIAQGLLKEKCRVRKTLVVENINGDIDIRGGNSIYLAIPDLAEIGIEQQVLVERCTHIYEDGIHRMKMEIRVEE